MSKNQQRTVLCKVYVFSNRLKEKVMTYTHSEKKYTAVTRHTVTDQSGHLDLPIFSLSSSHM